MAKLLEGAVQMIRGDTERSFGAFGGQQRAASEQLTDECGADALEGRDQRLVVCERELEALPVVSTSHSASRASVPS